MNNVFFEKNVKLHTRNRNGMIRSYRTTRNCTQLLLLVIDMILTGFDRILDVLARPARLRLVRGVIAISCLISFIFLIAAIEQQLLSLGTAIILSLGLMILEIVCLRGK